MLALPEIRYTENVWEGGIHLEVPTRLLQSPFREDGRNHEVIVETEQDFGEGWKPMGASIWFVGPAGYGYVSGRGVTEADRYDTPKIVLPRRARPGMTWEGTHSVQTPAGPRTHQRACALAAESAVCPEGVAVTCVTQMGEGREIRMRDHFCAGGVWWGVEAEVREGGQAVRRVWSTDVDLGQGPLTTPSIEARGFP